MPKINNVLGVFRDYSSLVVPAVLTGVAVIILLVTPMLMGSRLGAKVEKKSLALARTARNLGQTAVSGEQWREAEKYLRAQKADANQIALLAGQTTRREPLSYKVFPEPKDSSVGVYLEFGQQYRSSIDALLEKMNAAQCPTEEEIQSILAASGGGEGRVTSIMPPLTAGNSADDMIIDVVCSERAKSVSTYAQPFDLAGYQYWQPGESAHEGEKFEYKGMKESVGACWYWQLGYWIIEDVAATVSAVNSGSKSVFTSPVKRLVKVGFIQEGPTFVEKGEDRPTYVTLKEGESSQVLTSRSSNDEIDVVHFRVSVVVSNQAVLPFMKELCSGKQHRFRGYAGDEPEQVFSHNQITILDSAVIAVDRNSVEHRLYRYGGDAVVELDLICEYVFKTSGYDKIKPESVKGELESGVSEMPAEEES